MQKNIREAMVLVKESFGPDAVILSNKNTEEGVELIITDEFYDDANISKEKIEPMAESKQIVDLKYPSEIAINELREDFESLKNLIQEQLSELIWEHKKRLYPSQALVIRKLINLGFSTEVASAIGGSLDPNEPNNEIWKTVKNKIIQSLPNVSKNGLQKGIAVILGATGSGKTTTVAKLAAQYALKFGAHNVAIISTDTTRIGANEGIKNLCKHIKSAN